jgi:hypothetical protein
MIYTGRYGDPFGMLPILIVKLGPVSLFAFICLLCAQGCDAFYGVVFTASIYSNSS